jgi:glycosyltransferase involved in cell wall biosynthesis
MAVIALKRIAQEVPRMHLEFNIFGPIVEKDYFKDIMAKIRHDPRENLKISYLGTLKRSNVYSALGSHHFMLLPTAGENFGYIVIEGAAVGCVPIISRFTAWADIQERGAGFVVDISSQESLESDLKNILSQFSPTAYEKLSKNALSYYRKKIIEDDAWSQHEKIFERVSHEV